MGTSSGFLNKSEFLLTLQLAWNTLHLLSLDFRAGLADMPDCAHCGNSLEETAEHAFYYCKQVHLFWDHVEEWKARIEPKQLVLLDIGYIVDNVLPPFQSEKHVVFLTIVWWCKLFSLWSNILLWHQLRVKIGCDRKRMHHITFNKRWVNAASLVIRKGAMLESSFPPLPAHGVYSPGPSGPHPR